MWKQYALWLGGAVVLPIGAFVLVYTRVLPGYSGLSMFGVYWLWTGLVLMLNQHPEYRKWDRWEKQAYGFALAVMGALWTALSLTPLSKEWLPCILSLVPPALIALVGRFWYVEKKRNEEYYKTQTEKD